MDQTNGEARDREPGRPTIGQAGQPVRALAFAGGGYDAALQIGVVHALLASRGEVPNLVVGVSAGAVNATALAEVLQARPSGGDEGGTEDATRAAQERRFREMFEALQASPGALLTAALPDAFQIETRRPLEPLELPIHPEKERRQREEAIGGRSGLINLYNRLLQIRIPIGTLARATRRALGLKAAGEMPGRLRTLLACVAEFTQLWVLIGLNLLRLAPLLVWLTGVRPWEGPDSGANAGQLIFRSRIVLGLWKAFVNALSFLLLGVLWSFLTAFALTTIVAALHLLGAALLEVVAALRGDPFAFSDILHRVWPLRDAGPALSGAVAAAVGALGSWYVARDRREIKPQWVGGLFVRTVETVLLLLGLLFGWVLALAALVLAVDALCGAGRPPLEVVRIGFAALLALAFACFLAFLWVRANHDRGFLRGILHDQLEKNGIHRSILNPHPLRTLYVRLFDPKYYGKTEMADVVEAALCGPGVARRRGTEEDGQADAAKIGVYAGRRERPIHLGIVAAGVRCGKLEVLPEDVNVVDGLLAATAAAPMLPAVELESEHFSTQDERGSIGKTLFVDGTNIANEPTRSAIDHLRQYVHVDAEAVHLYTVSHLPVGASKLGPPPASSGRVARPLRELADLVLEARAVDTLRGRLHQHLESLHIVALTRRAGRGPAAAGDSRPYRELVDVLLRARQLQRFRYSKLERRLIRLYSRTIPKSHRGVLFPTPDDPKEREGTYLRAAIHAIEPEHPLSVNLQLLEAGGEAERRRIVAETVAEGCRLSLETMIGPAIRELASAQGEAQHVACWPAVRAHLERWGEPNPQPDLQGDTGSSGAEGSGIPEVCRHCRLQREPRSSDDSQPAPTQVLAVKEATEDADEWPVEGSTRPPGATRPSAPPAARKDEDRIEISDWPRARNKVDGSRRPTVSFLFSGGVFRGVFQMGALNALNEVGLKPDIVAGASVGSMTAAMVARVFAEKSERERRKQIRELAASYLAMDRIVLTDRFADFVREFTIRASESRFSLRQADRAFRRYDARGLRFDRELRRVLAGLERLLFISPFEVLELFDAERRRDTSRFVKRLHAHTQDLLNRSGVRDQLLGAEPLQLLIRKHVTEKCDANGRCFETFDSFREAAGILFLATATNLTQGGLEVLGETPADGQLSLLEGLLASSAFPGLFRPRWSWELRARTDPDDRYIDGGVMDNLPLDAVVDFLFRASKRDIVTPRPGTPHLLFCASLREEPDQTPEEISIYREDWISLISRTKTLGYNDKLKMFQRAQRDVRKMEKQREAKYLPNESFVPLDLEVVAVTPKWLCGTFAFHPMLGFKRDQQARSIAHGCASTLLYLARLSGDAEKESWMEAWGLETERLPDAGTAKRVRPFDPVHLARNDDCWFRPEHKCPFAASELHEGLGAATRKALSRIHELCGQRRTHEP